MREPSSTRAAAWSLAILGLFMGACGNAPQAHPEEAPPEASSTVAALAPVVPLFDASTPLEPALVVDTPTALITRLADRSRDRHARESQFQSYEHYLPLYFEYRTYSIEVIDRVAKGGNDITVNITSLWPLDTPDFRAFYQGQAVLSQYWFNVDMAQVDPLRYTATINYNAKENRRLQVGDRMEIEISPFMLPPVVGRANYYGTAFLYIVGQGGMVPWEGRGANLDSFPLAETAWLGGRTTLGYNYSNEPAHLFKQMATNLAPVNAQPFVEGRRLHHTDFADGSHSEAGNPSFTAQQNKLGPSYIARSCVACHINNGRALPPDPATSLYTVRFYVNAAPWADVHYRLNGGSQQSFRMARDSSGTNTQVLTNVPAGSVVQYHFTIGNSSGGLSTTSPVSITVNGADSTGASPHGHVVVAPPLRHTVRVGVVGTTVTAHPALGWVLQPQSTQGTPEGSVSISGWTVTNGTYGDGTGYQLRRPVYAFTGPVPTHHSARITPPLVGLGLLEAIDENTLASLADPNDANGDGISGRVQTVVDPQTGQTRAGRFGWKAGKARLRHQVANALNVDMGVTTSVFPMPDCGSQQTCAGASTELADADLEKMVRYIALLGVPARRNLGDAQALQGESLFGGMGCARCHVSTLTTSPYHPYAELRSQVIRPYTDLLLHDLGAGLADNLPEEGASGAEWRTPPLWGIGLTAGVSGGEAYLHDGRARSLSEAILWHGGEAESSKEAFRTASAAQRAALLRFLQSL
ncbi:thiol oxidoreductase [Myxococcus sp. MISCRS1]|uniref:di-heme oxidoredictase family protein n=1 Tax=Myxococcus sp. MISCRS1 TaxID=2996786 RepID=UPI00227029A2|nr:di-heme oxidoredictase family protein [Myxococcus sp. MISCRS1]MCY0997777.1 thiol oxidoreductase [Myxococcus sp. MISCRS1]